MKTPLNRELADQAATAWHVRVTRRFICCWTRFPGRLARLSMTCPSLDGRLAQPFDALVALLVMHAIVQRVGRPTWAKHDVCAARESRRQVKGDGGDHHTWLAAKGASQSASGAVVQRLMAAVLDDELR
jgi:hypothetical protein